MKTPGFSDTTQSTKEKRAKEKKVFGVKKHKNASHNLTSERDRGSSLTLTASKHNFAHLSKVSLHGKRIVTAKRRRLNLLC